MLALVLIDAALHHRAQCADVDCPTPAIPGQGPGRCLIEFAANFQ
jgi:chorismate synthase